MPAPRLLFRPRHRLTHKRQFDAVYAAKMKTHAGPLTVYSRRNHLDHPRLGLAIGRAFGGAVQRNRLKRCLRESFRLLQLHIPVGRPQPEFGCYDLVISCRRHDNPGLEACSVWLLQAVEKLDQQWRKREERNSTRAPDARQSTGRPAPEN